MLGLSLYNFAMRLLTLGFYHFWGKTEVRRRIWSAIRINGEPVEYTGTGGELFKGFLVILGLVIVPVMLLSLGAVLLFGPNSTGLAIYQILIYGGFVLLTGIAIYRAQRFRLSRTRWRGIRAGIDGSSWHYGWTYFWTLLTLPLTLGWSAPWRATKLQRILTNDMRFGTMPFTFSASSRPLYAPFALFWVLMAIVVVVLSSGLGMLVTPNLVEGDNGELIAPPSSEKIAAIVAAVYGGLFLAGMLYVILSSWYRATTIRHFARHTHLGGVGFDSSVSASGLLGIAVTNYLILILGATLVTSLIAAAALAVVPLPSPQEMAQGERAAMPLASFVGIALVFVFLTSLGMLLPVTQARSTGYLVRNLKLRGGLDMHAVEAGAEPDMKRGEGLAQAFDIDAY